MSPSVGGLPIRHLVASVLLTLAACGGETPRTAQGGGTPEAHPPGRLVIVGGALQDENAEVYQAIAEGRDGDGPLCVLPTASGAPQESMESARGTLGRYVGDSLAVGIFLTENNAADANDSSLVRRLGACSGYFFTGGDQSRVVDTFLPAGDTTGAYRAVTKRWRDGAVVSGSSAGAAMMSGVMIASGSSAGAVQNGITHSEDDGVWIRRGMGFFERAVIDQHFLSRGRIGRLLVAVLGTDSLPVGLGIDENTALVVDGDVATVRGASGVVVVDGRQAHHTAPGRGAGLRVVLAGSGDSIDLTTFRVTRGSAKSAIRPTEQSLPDLVDPFGRWAFLHLLSGLASSQQSQASFEVAGARLSVREGEAFSASRHQGEGVQGEPAGLSAGPFMVDLVDRGG